MVSPSSKVRATSGWARADAVPSPNARGKNRIRMGVRLRMTITEMMVAEPRRRAKKVVDESLFIMHAFTQIKSGGTWPWASESLSHFSLLV